MILIQSAANDDLAKLIPSTACFSLATTTCRACKRRLAGSGLSPTPNALSPEVIRNTRMYDCAGKIADGEEVDIILGSHAAFSVSVEDLASTMDISCRVYGVSADERTLRRVNELRKENLMLPFLPGAFL
jgi:hypothetical protein